MTCPGIPADIVAYADQRMASASEFVDRMVDTELQAPPDAVAVLSLAMAFVDGLGAVAAADALAVAVHRLAAQKRTGAPE